MKTSKGMDRNFKQMRNKTIVMPPNCLLDVIGHWEVMSLCVSRLKSLSSVYVASTCVDFDVNNAAIF